MIDNKILEKDIDELSEVEAEIALAKITAIIKKDNRYQMMINGNDGLKKRITSQINFRADEINTYTEKNKLPKIYDLFNGNLINKSNNQRKTTVNQKNKYAGEYGYGALLNILEHQNNFYKNNLNKAPKLHLHLNNKGIDHKDRLGDIQKAFPIGRETRDNQIDPSEIYALICGNDCAMEHEHKCKGLNNDQMIKHMIIGNKNLADRLVNHIDGRMDEVKKHCGNSKNYAFERNFQKFQKVFEAFKNEVKQKNHQRETNQRV
jgi:hypothetical protein